MEESTKKTDESTITTILQVISVLCAIIGIYAAVAILDNYHRADDWVLAIVSALSGIVSAVLWWALSIIVAACRKYLNSEKQ